MTKPINEYTVDELSAKIEAIKAEREKTANALKRYEEELERKKQEVPLGVPVTGNFCVNFNNKVCNFNNEHSVEEMEYNIFNTLESAEKHAEMILAWRKALVANTKGEPIDIAVLLLLLPKGWVAMNKYKNEWIWHEKKPTCYSGAGLEYWESDGWKVGFLPFNLKPAEDWRNSLMECGI